jgi:hypothetical protein
MSEGPMSEIHDCSGDAAAYVLGALAPAEIQTFHRHLATCSICQDEVQSLKLLSDTLPLAAPQFAAPKSLRKQLMAEVRADVKARRPARAQWRPSFSFSLAGPALAGAMAVALVAVIALHGNTPTTHIYGASVGNASLRVTDNHGELVVRDLTQPADGQIYEVWLKRGSAAPSPTKALFSTTSAGQGDVDVPGSLHNVSEVLVTEQPADQTRVPTGRALIVARLT